MAKDPYITKIDMAPGKKGAPVNTHPGPDLAPKEKEAEAS